MPLSGSVGAGGKVTARGLRAISYGAIDIDLGAVEQLVEVGQTRGVRGWPEMCDMVLS